MTERKSREEYIQFLKNEIENAENQMYYADKDVEKAEQALQSAQRGRQNVLDSIEELKNQYFYTTGEEYDPYR